MLLQAPRDRQKKHGVGTSRASAPGSGLYYSTLLFLGGSPTEMRCRAATRATAAGPRRRRQRRPRRAPWSGRAGPRRRALVRRVRPSRSLAGGGGVWLAVACGAGARCGAARGGALGRGALVARAPQARKSAALALEVPLALTPGARRRRGSAACGHGRGGCNSSPQKECVYPVYEARASRGTGGTAP